MKYLYWRRKHLQAVYAHCDRLIITHIHKKSTCGHLLPVIDPEIWKPVDKEEYTQDDDTHIPYTYIIYGRKRE